MVRQDREPFGPLRDCSFTRASLPLGDKAAKAGRWLGYVAFDRISDERNAPAEVFVQPPKENFKSLSTGMPDWRIVLNWIEAELAMIKAGLFRLEEVLLPFAQDPAGVTLYERIRQAKFPGLLLEDGESNTRG